MIGGRNPVKDRVAFATATTTGFTPHNTDRSALSYATEACIAALRDCGLTAADVDAICGSISFAASPTGPFSWIIFPTTS